MNKFVRNDKLKLHLEKIINKKVQKLVFSGDNYLVGYMYMNKVYLLDDQTVEKVYRSLENDSNS